MVILSLDTSSAAGSAAIARDGAILVERVGDGSRTHGERLPRELMAVLDAAGVTLREVNHFAVATGPGSFTGLRVGIATIQGLAVAADKRVTPVSSFEALAFLASSQPATPGCQDPIGIWIDAHRGEVFAALYGSDGRTEVHRPTSLTPEATLDAWQRAAGRTTIRFAGDGAVKYAAAIRAALGDRADLPDAVPPLAGAIALLATADASRAVAPHAVVPLYVRRPDAELARDRRARAGDRAR